MERVHRYSLDRAQVRKPRPIKLIIQIPCFNEENTLAATLRALPRAIPGIDVIEWLVIDDGSSDLTAEIARKAGADHILQLPVHMGLARAFMAGLEHATDLGADIIVNTDADNQYDARDIPRLIAPILACDAELVIGNRPINHIQHFSRKTRWLQALGSRVVRWVSKADVGDAPSGFRALSREAALRMNVFNDYTYTLETVIQAGLSGIKTQSVPIQVNGKTRPSRLVRSNGDYIRRALGTIARVALVYEPGRIFFLFGLFQIVASLSLLLHWLWITDIGTREAPTVSFIAAIAFLALGIATWLCGLLAELAVINRRLLEDIQYRLRKRSSVLSSVCEKEGPAE